MTDLVRWLDARRPASPPSLRQAIIDALGVSDPGTGPVADRLAAVGVDALASVAAEPSTRSGAVRLLAADALITYACEAAVEEEAMERNSAVERVMQRLDLPVFARILERAESG